MAIYKNRSIREGLLTKLEELEPSSEFSKFSGVEKWDELYEHSDNYFKLYSIIKNYGDDLPYIHGTLLDIMNRLFKNREFIKTDYDKYRHNCKLYNLRLSILERRLKHESGGQYHHDYFCMRDLPKLGCRYGCIENLTHMRNGTPDYRAESIFGSEHEIKIITRNIICFTRDQLLTFDRHVNILTYKRADSPRINSVGAEFDNHIKFGDMYDALLKNKIYFSHKFGNRLLDSKLMIYQVTVEGSSDIARSIIKNRHMDEQRADTIWQM